MPYRLIKRIIEANKHPIARGSYGFNFGFFLDDNKTWKLYSLMVKPPAQIKGKIIRLLDGSGKTISDVNEDHVFDTFCEGYYDGSGNVNETRFLYLPIDFVRDYGVDTSMVVEVILDSLVYDFGGGLKEATAIYSKKHIDGALDFPSIESQVQNKPVATTSEKDNSFVSLNEFRVKISQIQSLMVQASTYKIEWKTVESEYQKLYSELAQIFVSYGIENPNPFSKLADFYGYWSMKLKTWKERRAYINVLYSDVEALLSQKRESPPLHQPINSKEYDVFICHAFEDKEPFVRELAESLSKEITVWYDKFSLTLGDSLRKKIDEGIANSRYGIIILSENFFRKNWPQIELDGLLAKEYSFDKVILPIWHGVTRERVLSFSPTLAGRLAVSSDTGVDNVVKEILKVVKSKS